MTSVAIAQQPPPGFTLETIAEGFDRPSTVAPAPDGRIFVGQQDGRIYLVTPDSAGRVLSAPDEPFAELEVFNSSESGLLSLVVDPDFRTNGRLYALATVNHAEQHILQLTTTNDRLVDLRVIRANLPSSGNIHNGGALAIGPDGRLYFGIGDTGTPDSAVGLTSLAGKICRINVDGAVPEDNPFKTPTGSPSAIFATGFRNPFSMSFDADGVLYVGDVGSDDDVRFEEINRVEAGRDYGWPAVEGDDTESVAAASVRPLLSYHDQGAAITGVVIYTADVFPQEYHGNLFHLDFVSSGLFRAVIEDGRIASHERFLDTDPGPTAMKLAADGSLVFCEFLSGNLRRLRYGARKPVLTDDLPTINDNSSPPPPTSSPPAPACGGGAGAAMIGLLVTLLMLRWVDAPRRARRTQRKRIEESV